MQIEDCDSLRYLSQLEELKLKKIRVEAEVLADILDSLNGLTALEIVHILLSDVKCVLDSIFLLSELKALAFVPTVQAARQIYSPPHMSLMQLTKLTWNFDVSLLQLMRLSEVKHFEVQIGNQDCLEDLDRSLRSMTDLHCLSIRNFKKELAPGDFLAGMTSLRQLEVVGLVEADSAMYQTLATFPELTDLCLQYFPETRVCRSFYSQINLLTNLRSLAICSSHGGVQHKGLLDSLSGENLKRLQRLNVCSAHLNLDGRAALFRRLPSLRYYSGGRVMYLSDW